MDTGSYRFPLGGFQCASISDGTFNYPLEAFFANAPREKVEEVLRQHDLPTDRITTPYTCLFVDTGQHRVLIDTGAGNLAAAAPMMFPSIDHATTVTGTLLRNLVAIRIEPSSVDTVIITHARPDHVGGTLDDDGTLAFGSARYVVPRIEWEFWLSEAATERAPAPMVDIARRNLEAMRDRLSLVDDGAEMVPGIRVVASPGHTPGHVALSITSNGEQLLHISDVVLYPLHLEHPDWVPVFDILPEQAAASKRRIFDRAAEQQVLVFAHHFPPFPNLGHVHEQGDGWRWQPIQHTS
jgi:glyoxylase-like metal-dependent hydrolase (beta-lactamase superfamily II)